MKIKGIEISGLWGMYDLEWELDSKVNILSGANGTGKSTILSAVANLLQREAPKEDEVGKIHRVRLDFDTAELIGRSIHGKYGDLKMQATTDNAVADVVKFFENEHDAEKKESNLIEIKSYQTQYISKASLTAEDFFKGVNATVINTFDCYVPAKKPDDLKTDGHIKTELDRHLDMGLNDYQAYLAKISTRIEQSVTQGNASEIVRTAFDRKNQFLTIVDRFFAYTGKSVVREDPSRFRLADGNELSVYQLSSGEKQLLYILLEAMAMDGKEGVMIMDEPEISLHIDWQRELIDSILELNPNCQLIIGTHAPSLILNGWDQAVSNIEDLRRDIAQKTGAR